VRLAPSVVNLQVQTGASLLSGQCKVVKKSGAKSLFERQLLFAAKF